MERDFIGFEENGTYYDNEDEELGEDEAEEFDHPADTQFEWFRDEGGE